MVRIKPSITLTHLLEQALNFFSGLSSVFYVQIREGNPQPQGFASSNIFFDLELELDINDLEEEHALAINDLEEEEEVMR